MQTTSASTAARPVRLVRRAGCSSGRRGGVIARSGLVPGERGPAGVARSVVELFLDAEQLVVLGHPFRPGGRTGLDLTAVGRDGEVGDRRVLGLAGPVA